MRYLGPHWREILLAAGVIVVALGGIIAWMRREPHDPAEVERKRRAYLNRVGRIAEGQILEIVDAPADAQPQRRRLFSPAKSASGDGGNGFRKLLFYTYSISGVTYETAQDITGLEERACLDRLVAGQPASVKYDPSNPSNSILLADDWSGLH